MDKIDIKSMTAREIEQSFLPNFTESFRAKQVYGWLVKGVSSFEEMSNIPQKLKDFLNQNYFIASVKIKSKKISLDGTIKYLFELYDGQLIEAVVMKYNHGYSMCLSTQVGCKMGCAFCVTGKGGFARNLMPSEMIAQVEAAGKDENIKIPADFDYSKLAGLRLEAREKLKKIAPLTLGQAERISGVSPADINVLTIYLKQKQYKEVKNGNETNNN